MTRIPAPAAAGPQSREHDQPQQQRSEQPGGQGEPGAQPGDQRDSVHGPQRLQEGGGAQCQVLLDGLVIPPCHQRGEQQLGRPPEQGAQAVAAAVRQRHDPLDAQGPDAADVDAAGDQRGQQPAGQPDPTLSARQFYEADEAEQQRHQSQRRRRQLAGPDYQQRSPAQKQQSSWRGVRSPQAADQPLPDRQGGQTAQRRQQAQPERMFPQAAPQPQQEQVERAVGRADQLGHGRLGARQQRALRRGERHAQQPVQTERRQQEQPRDEWLRLGSDLFQSSISSALGEHSVLPFPAPRRAYWTSRRGCWQPVQSVRHRRGTGTGVWVTSQYPESAGTSCQWGQVSPCRSQTTWPARRVMAHSSRYWASMQAQPQSR